MLYFLFFILGVILALLLVGKPLQIKIHHVNEELHSVPAGVDMKSLEEEMLKDNAKEDELYKKLDNVIVEANDIMGGSDRIDRD